MGVCPFYKVIKPVYFSMRGHGDAKTRGNSSCKEMQEMISHIQINQPFPNGIFYQTGVSANTELIHDTGAMVANGFWTDAKRIGNCLI